MNEQQMTKQEAQAQWAAMVRGGGLPTDVAGHITARVETTRCAPKRHRPCARHGAESCDAITCRVVVQIEKPFRRVICLGTGESWEVALEEGRLALDRAGQAGLEKLRGLGFVS